MAINLCDFFEEVVFLEDMSECLAEADEARVKVLRMMLAAEVNAAQKLQLLMVETWREDQQWIEDALEGVAFVQACAQRFRDFRSYSSTFVLEDDGFHEAMAYLDSLYLDIIRTSEDNLRVAEGRGRQRVGNYPDDFIGPTGYISF